MSINGKRDDFTTHDLLTVANLFGIKGVGEIIERIGEVVSQWLQFARKAEVPPDLRDAIAKTHRLHILKRRQKNAKSPIAQRRRMKDILQTYWK